MPKLEITEISVTPSPRPDPLATIPDISNAPVQQLDIGTEAKTSAPFKPRTSYISVIADADCRIKIAPKSQNQAAPTASDWKLTANERQQFVVRPNFVISVVAA
jgi:hypothetical protein